MSAAGLEEAVVCRARELATEGCEAGLTPRVTVEARGVEHLGQGLGGRGLLRGRQDGPSYRGLRLAVIHVV